MRRLACPPSPVRRQARLEPYIARFQARRRRRPLIGAEQPTIETLRHQLGREARDSGNELKRSHFNRARLPSWSHKKSCSCARRCPGSSLSSGISVAEARNEATPCGTSAFTMASATPVRLHGEPSARRVSNLQPSTWVLEFGSTMVTRVVEPDPLGGQQ